MCESLQKFRPTDFITPQTLEMRVGDLTVDKSKFPVVQPVRQGSKRRFRRVGFALEHRLAKEGGAETDAIDAAG